MDREHRPTGVRAVAAAFAAALALGGCATPAVDRGVEPASSASPAPGPSPVAPLAVESDTTWVERVTPGGSEAGAQALPLVVAIHGLGDAPERFCRLFDDFRASARVACPRAFAKHGKSGWSWFPPGRKGAEQAADIASSADRLATAITAYAASKPTAGKPIVVGFSQGGALSFAMAVRHPDDVRLAVPVGGWLPNDLRPSAGAPIAPIVALHGEADERVPLEPTREAVGALSAIGARAEMKTFPGVGHSIPPEVRSALFAAIVQALDAPSPRAD